MSMFKSWQQRIIRPKEGANGLPVMKADGQPVLETIEVPRWSTEATVNWLRTRGRDLTRNACRDGWHINLIDFVQHQHRLPRPDECEELVLDFQKLERETEFSPKRQEILKKREQVKAELLKPLEMKAAG